MQFNRALAQIQLRHHLRKTGRTSVFLLSQRGAHFWKYSDDLWKPETWKWELHPPEKFKKWDNIHPDELCSYRSLTPRNNLWRREMWKAELMGAFFFFWIFYHLYYLWDHLSAEFPWPTHKDLAMLSDEELGIPPDDRGPCPKIEHPDREVPNERLTLTWRPKFRPPTQKNYYGD